MLEVGAGTGYNAALLAELVGETGFVVTVDIDATWCCGHGATSVWPVTAGGPWRMATAPRGGPPAFPTIGSS